MRMVLFKICYWLVNSLCWVPLVFGETIDLNGKLCTLKLRSFLYPFWLSPVRRRIKGYYIKGVGYFDDLVLRELRAYGVEAGEVITEKHPALAKIQERLPYLPALDILNTDEQGPVTVEPQGTWLSCFSFQSPSKLKGFYTCTAKIIMTIDAGEQQIFDSGLARSGSVEIALEPGQSYTMTFYNLDSVPKELCGSIKLYSQPQAKG